MPAIEWCCRGARPFGRDSGGGGSRIERALHFSEPRHHGVQPRRPGWQYSPCCSADLCRFGSVSTDHANSNSAAGCDPNNHVIAGFYADEYRFSKHSVGDNFRFFSGCWQSHNLTVDSDTNRGQRASDSELADHRDSFYAKPRTEFHDHYSNRWK